MCLFVGTEWESSTNSRSSLDIRLFLVSGEGENPPEADSIQMP